MIAIETQPRKLRPAFVAKASFLGAFAAASSIGVVLGLHVLAVRPIQAAPFRPTAPRVQLDLGAEPATARYWGAGTAVALESNKVRVIDVALGRGEAKTLEVPGLGAVVALDVWGHRLALGDKHGGVSVCENETDGGKDFFEAGGPVQSLAFSRDGRLLVAASDSGTVLVREVEGVAHTIEKWSVHPGSRLAVDDSNGYTLVVATEGEPLEVRNLAGTVLRYLGDTDGHVLAIASHEGVVATGGCCGSNTIQILDSRTGGRLQRCVGHQGPITSLRFTPDGERLVSGSKDQTIRVWSVASGAQVRCLRENRAPRGLAQVRSIDVSPDGTRALVASQSDFLEIWDLESGREITKRP